MIPPQWNEDDVRAATEAQLTAIKCEGGAKGQRTIAALTSDGPIDESSVAVYPMSRPVPVRQRKLGCILVHETPTADVRRASSGVKRVLLSAELTMEHDFLSTGLASMTQ